MGTVADGRTPLGGTFADDELELGEGLGEPESDGLGLLDDDGDGLGEVDEPGST